MDKKNKITALLCALFMTCCAAMAQTTKTEAFMSNKEQNITLVAALAAKGDLESLKTALGRSLDDEMTINEVKEVLVHSYAYCGFPRALRGLQTLAGVLDERKSKGINDKQGRDATEIKDKRSKYERGRETLNKLSGGKNSSSKPAYAQLSPEIDVFLKEHLFADIFDRDILTYQERELATVSVIATLGKGVEPMLRSHIGVAMNTGVKPSTLRCLFGLIERNIGRSEADSSLAPMMNFFPFIQIETISPRPLLFIAGEKAVSKYFSEDAYNRAAEPKELFIVPGATHVDLYDRPEYLKITLPKLDSFFKANL